MLLANYGKFMVHTFHNITPIIITFIKIGARGQSLLKLVHTAFGHAHLVFARAWFLEIVLVRVSVCMCVCVSVCPPPRPLITSGVIWCDIGRVRLVKQVLRLFPAFNYFIRHLPSIKWMGVAILK